MNIISNIFGVTPDYLLCKTDYRTQRDKFAAFQKKQYEKHQLLFVYLECHGYIIKHTPYSYYAPQTIYKENDIIGKKTFSADDIKIPIYEVTTPDKEIKYINANDLINLESDFFTKLNQLMYSCELITNDLKH